MTNPLLSELRSLYDQKIERLENERDDARSILHSWFSLAALADHEVVPAVVDGFAGYLRTCRIGGMPLKDSNMAQSTFEDFARLYLGRILVPAIRNLTEETDG